jgi:hypothetical protein
VEYVTGQTTNPLVAGPNVTTQSDARIFASDGNVTMKALANSPSLFSSTCASLLERMLNTVPRDVVLTEIIDPLPVKPADFFISRSTDGSFTLTGNIRVSFVPSLEVTGVSSASAPSSSGTLAQTATRPCISSGPTTLENHALTAPYRWCRRSRRGRTSALPSLGTTPRCGSSFRHRDCISALEVSPAFGLRSPRTGRRGWRTSRASVFPSKRTLWWQTRRARAPESRQEDAST